MKTGFMFAGQGAQQVGMAMELKGNSVIDELFMTADEIVPGIIDIMSSDQEKLNDTLYTQPAMFVADLAYALSSNIVPSAICGFSVGEIPALAFAGAFSVADGLKIIKKRAELMSDAGKTNSGSMVAVIGLDAVTVEQIADSIDGAWTANYNGPKQTVVAVTETSYDDLINAVALNKGRAIKLKVSGAFHCPLLSDASEKLREFVSTIKCTKPTIDVYANTTALPYTDDIAQTLKAQMASAVRFTQTIANMKSDGIQEFVEMGAGNVLTGLLRKM